MRVSSTKGWRYAIFEWTQSKYIKNITNRNLKYKRNKKTAAVNLDKSAKSRLCRTLIGHVFSWVRALVLFFSWVKTFMTWSKNFFLVVEIFSLGQNIFLMGQTVLLVGRFFFLAENRLLSFSPMSKVKFLSPWDNPGYFDRPSSDLGDTKVT